MERQPDRESAIRKELEAAYARNVDAFKRNDTAYLEEVFAPDFQVTDFNGETHDRQFIVNYIRKNAQTFRVLELSMEITELTIEDDRAIAIVEQKGSRAFNDEQGVSHQLDVGAIQRETWVKTADGWRLQRVEEMELLYALKDGEPMTQ
jgi:hypothetical protein